MSKRSDSNQLNLFNEEELSSNLTKIHELDEQIRSHVSANESHAAKAAAQKQEALLKKLIQQKKQSS